MLNTNKISIHLQNKEESFSGMRAYHNSELNHKKDCVEIFKASLTLVVLIYGGFIGATISEKVPDFLLISAAIFSFISISVLTAVILVSTNRKIDEDSNRYKLYSEEYKAERRILGLENDLNNSGFESAWNTRKPTGAPYTKRILNSMSALVISSALIGCVFSIVLAINVNSVGATEETKVSILCKNS